jgi:hypothetical protein
VASSSSSSSSSSLLQQQRYGCSSIPYHQLPYMSALRSICLQFSLYKGHSQESSWRRSGGGAGGRERRGGFARAWSTSMSTGWKGEQSPYETLGKEEVKPLKTNSRNVQSCFGKSCGFTVLHLSLSKT